MLKTLRENFKHLKWILWAVIAIFVLFVFVDWGMGTTKLGADSDVAAQVGNGRITVGEFQREYRNTEDRYRQMYGKNYTPEVAKALNLPSQVLNGLIDRRLFRAEAARLGLRVTDAEVSQKILQMPGQDGTPAFVRDGQFVGDAAYRRMLASINMTPESFEADVREQLLLEKLNRFLTESTFVGDDEVREDFASRTVRAKIAYVLLPASPVTPGAITDAEAEAWFKGHAAQYAQPEKRRVKYLLVETAKLRDAIKVSDADVAAEYQANADSYRKAEEIHARHILFKSDGSPDGDAAAKAKAEAALKKLRGGADFAALARAESDDPGSKASGGDLGSFPRGRMVKEFEDAAFAAQPNTVVGPVKTPFGYHLIEVLGKTPERVQPLFEVQDSIRLRLQEERATAEARRLARELATKLSKIGKPSDDDMRKLARPGVTFNETDLFGRSDAPAGIGVNPAFTQAVFELKEGQVSEPIATARGEAIARLVEIRPPGPATFAEVKARVVSDLARQKQDEATVSALKAAVTPGATLEEVAAKLGLKVETPDSFAKAGPIPGLGSPRPVLDAAFAAQPGSLTGPVFVPDRGAVLFRLVEKTPFDETAFAAQKADIRERLKGQKSGKLLQSLVTRLRAETRIVVNQDVLARFGGQA